MHKDPSKARACILGQLRFHQPGTPERVLLDRLYEMTCRADPEQAHWEADKSLLEYLSATGREGLAEAWDSVSDAFGFWYA